MKTNFITILLCSMLISLFTITETNAQSRPLVVSGAPNPPGPISGPASVVMPTATSQYSVPAIVQGITLNWSLSPGTAGSISASINQATVSWNTSFTGSAIVSCTASNSSGTSAPSTLTVTVTAGFPALAAGSVSPTSQYINYNTVPKTITCTAATGGNGIYTYQWQSSTNNIIWANISGATVLSYTPQAQTLTTWYQLIATSNGVNVNSNAAIVMVNPASNPANTDTTFNTAMNHIFGTLNTANVPFGLLRDYAMEFTNLENYNGAALADSNIIDKGVLRSIYMTLGTARMTGSAYTALPNTNTIDSLWQIARQPGQVTLCGLFYQYAYINTNTNPNPNITLTNGQLFDKYVNSVWQNPYLQGSTVGFAPSTSTYNALNFNIVLPANLWFTNSGALVSQIQIDAGDGLGYRTITPGMPLPVMYADTGLKVWNFKVLLTNSAVLQSHSQISVRGTVNNLTCYTAGCSPYTPPGGGGLQSMLKTSALTANNSTMPADVISGVYPYYLFSTGATFNGISAQGVVNLKYASTNTAQASLINPLIVVEGFDETYYTHPESPTGLNAITDFLKYNVAFSNSLLTLMNSKYDIVYITFKNGTDDIHRNALLVESVIRWVNANKTGTNKNVVLGLSMGGLCARYALKKMEVNGETHQVGLFVCHGSPQQGVVVPLGLQYLENHINNLYIRAGIGVAAGKFVQTAYQYIQVMVNPFGYVAPPAPANIKGLLTLTDAPAAEQMLGNRVNDNSQLDNTVHNQWQAELAALPYPSQGGIRNIAISNGSECGQTQTLAQGGQLLYIDGKLHTSFLGDLLGTMLFPAFAVLAGQPAFQLGAIPGRNDISMHFAANATSDGGGSQIYTGKMTYKKTILWLIPVSINLTNRSYNAPSGVLPYETFAGDFYRIPVGPLNLTSTDSTFAKYKITLSIAPSFGFVPTPSVLDIGQGSTTLLESDYSQPYSEAYPPASPKSTPFSNFITAFSATTSGEPNNNEEHITYETRNGNWLANELNATPTIADCTALCQSNASGITGSQYICNNTVTYTVPSYSNVNYVWSVSPNLQMKSPQGSSTMLVQAISGTNGQQGTVTVTDSITTSPDCRAQPISRIINIGFAPLVVTSTVDRTPQPSNYQYLTATATQLPNTVPANYNWYLLVNNVPTTLIGTGLTLNSYPMAPCSIIYYQCQATTACGVSTYSGYAYNTSCPAGSASINTAVIVYPNPANTSMTVTNNNIPAAVDAAGNATGAVPQTYRIIVYDSNNKVITSAQNINGNANITFRTANIANGHYFLHVIQGSKVIEKQIIIQH